MPTLWVRIVFSEQKNISISQIRTEVMHVLSILSLFIYLLHGYFFVKMWLLCAWLCVGQRFKQWVKHYLCLQRSNRCLMGGFKNYEAVESIGLGVLLAAEHR
jgi:hypothetical protein